MISIPDKWSRGGGVRCQTDEQVAIFDQSQQLIKRFSSPYLLKDRDGFGPWPLPQKF
jgi:hypothetical protein